MLENTALVFQVFQLTALVVRAPVTCGGRFIINLDRVMICEDEVHSAILCVQDFIRSPHFTQQNFFSDSGIAMLAESASISDRIMHIAIFEPWSHVETTSRSQVLADVCGCVNEALDRRRVVKDWRAVVCGGWHQAIIGRFHIPIRCQDFKCRGRGASRVRSCTCPFFYFSWSQ